MSNNFVELLFGVIAAIVTLLMSIRDKKYGSLPYLLTICTCGVLFMQYREVSDLDKEKKDTAGGVGLAIWAFNEDDKDLGALKRATENPYFLGYRCFKNGDWEQAKMYFENAISSTAYVAPSYYILSYMESHRNDASSALLSSASWGNAEDELNKAIQFDSNYMPAHYLLAVLYANSGNEDQALSELRFAVMSPGQYKLSMIHNLQDESELRKSFGPVLDNREFRMIQKDSVTPP